MLKGTEHDPYYLLDKAVAEDKQIPKLLIMCGKQDFLYQDNLDFIDHLSRKMFLINLKMDQEIMIMHIGTKRLSVL